MMLPPLSRQTLLTLATTVWAILIGGTRIFALDSLKEGFIDVRPLPRVARFLSLAGIVVVFAFMASILFNDPLRWSGALNLIALASSAGHGVAVPAIAVPIAYLATIFAWTFLLTGALHVRAAVRWGVVICFFVFGLPGLFVGVSQIISLDNPTYLFLLLGVAGLDVLALLLALIVLPRARLSLAFEFVLILALVGGLFVLNLFVAVTATRRNAVDFVSSFLVPDAVTGARNLIIPFLFLAGAEMMNFGISFTRWGAQSAQRFGKAWVLGTLLAVLLIYRWFDFGWNHLGAGVSVTQAQAYLGALLAGIALIPLAWWRARYPFNDRVPLKLIVSLILVAVAPQMFVIVIFLAVGAFFLATVRDPGALSGFANAGAVTTLVSNLIRDNLYLIVAGAGVITTILALRAKRYTVAAYGILLAWLQFVWWFMESGRPLQDFRYHYQDLDPWILLALTALTLYWLARKQLTDARVLTLLALTAFAWVLNAVDFLDNPLALFFGFAGIFFTVFGILWGVLTAGGKFANYDSAQFPRLNRILLYLGYALLTINITHWFTVTHDLDQQILNSYLTYSGLRIFGFTAAYLVIVEGGRALLKKE